MGFVVHCSMITNREAETLVSRMKKLGYTLTGKVEMVAWGFWEGDFREDHNSFRKEHTVRVQFHENYIIFLKY